MPRLADKGLYLASESTFYRVLRQHNEVHHRWTEPASTAGTRAGHLRGNRALSGLVLGHHLAPSVVRGRWYYLYLILDIFSRKITGYEIHDTESGEQAAALMERAVLHEGCWQKPRVLHDDNGAAMKSQTLQMKLQELKILPSHSRPRVNNDNAYAESVFRTLKYVPQRPSSGFEDLVDAREWVEKFTRWYNGEHRHSGIRYVMPEQRHRVEDEGLLKQREDVHQAARSRHPERWTGKTRNWQPAGAVMQNPEREKRAA